MLEWNVGNSLALTEFESSIQGRHTGCKLELDIAPLVGLSLAGYLHTNSETLSSFPLTETTLL